MEAMWYHWEESECGYSACPRCHGHGIILLYDTSRDRHWANPEEVEISELDLADFDGFVDESYERKCPTCDGTGEIEFDVPVVCDEWELSDNLVV